MRLSALLSRAPKPAGPARHWIEELDDGASPSSVPMPSVSVVIPARNEAANIGYVLRALPDIVDEVIVVDGHSTDGTTEAATAARPDTRILLQEGRGKGDALRRGFDAARGDVVVMIDADGSMNPAEITRFVRLVGDGYEFVKGSRFMTGGGTSDMTAFRGFGAAALLAIANLLFRTRHTDLLYGYCAFRRSSLGRLALSSDGFEIETEIATRAALAGLRTAEVPSFEADRLNGSSKLHPIRDGFRVLGTLVRERFATRAPLVRPLPDAVSAEGAPAFTRASDDREAA